MVVSFLYINYKRVLHFPFIKSSNHKDDNLYIYIYSDNCESCLPGIAPVEYNLHESACMNGSESYSYDLDSFSYNFVYNPTK